LDRHDNGRPRTIKIEETTTASKETPQNPTGDRSSGRPNTTILLDRHDNGRPRTIKIEETTTASKETPQNEEKILL
jgi:hypothetical protein